MFGCQRDTSDVKKAIIGHWKTYEKLGEEVEEGKVSDIYISEEEITTIDSKGNESTEKYKISESNNKNGTLTIVTFDAEEKPFTQEYKFIDEERTKISRIYSFDGLSVNDNMTDDEKYSVELTKDIFGDMELEDKINYIDNKQTP